MGFGTFLSYEIVFRNDERGKLDGFASSKFCLVKQKLSYGARLGGSEPRAEVEEIEASMQ